LKATNKPSAHEGGKWVEQKNEKQNVKIELSLSKRREGERVGEGSEELSGLKTEMWRESERRCPTNIRNARRKKKQKQQLKKFREKVRGA